MLLETRAAGLFPSLDSFLKRRPDIIRAQQRPGLQRLHDSRVVHSRGLVQRFQVLSCSVARTIVRHDDLFVHLDGLDALQNLFNGGPLVIDGHDHREFGSAFGFAHQLLSSAPLRLRDTEMDSQCVGSTR